MIQRQLDISDWLRKWGIAINMEKSEAIYFKIKSICTYQSSEGRSHSEDGSVKYLDFRLDWRLTLNEHVTKPLKMAQGVRAIVLVERHVAVRKEVLLCLLFLTCSTYVCSARFVVSPVGQQA